MRDRPSNPRAALHAALAATVSAAGNDAAGFEARVDAVLDHLAGDGWDLVDAQASEAPMRFAPDRATDEVVDSYIQRRRRESAAAVAERLGFPRAPGWRKEISLVTEQPLGPPEVGS